jgi:hypothetical protein
MTIYFIGNEKKENIEGVAYITQDEALKALERVKKTHADARIYQAEIGTNEG